MKKTPFIGSLDGPWNLQMSGDPLRILIVGAGKMAEIHIQALLPVKGIEISAICSRTAEKAQKLAHKYGVRHTFDSLTTALGEIRPDAAWVAVSHLASYHVAKTLIEHHVPSLLEKPVALSLQEVDHLARLSDRFSCPCWAGVNRRFYSVLQKALLALKQSGPLNGIHIEAPEPISDYRNRQLYPASVYDNWLLANSIHAIDLFRLIGGEIAEVAAFHHQFSDKNADRHTAALLFRNGILGSFNSFFDAPRGYTLKLFGDGVVAHLQPLEKAFLHFDNGRRIAIKPDPIDLQFRPGVFAQNLAFAQYLADGKPSPMPYPASDLHDHLLSIKLIESIRNGQNAS